MHAFVVVILLVVFLSLGARKFVFLGALRSYLSMFGLPLSFLLSLVPTTNEPLTRLPLSHPLAEAPRSPVVLNALFVCACLFALGFAAQCCALYGRNKKCEVSNLFR